MEEGEIQWTGGKNERRLMKVKLIKSYVNEVEERGGSLPKTAIMVVRDGLHNKQMKYHK